jgi:hypothetical protein
MRPGSTPRLPGRNLSITPAVEPQLNPLGIQNDVVGENLA